MSNLIKFSQFNITVPFNEHYSIVFNTLTKALLLINNEELSKLKSGVSNLNITKDVKRLLKLGVLVYEDYDEAGKVINMLKNYRINDIKWRMNLVLVTSYRCNLSCPYCYVKDNLKAYSTEYGKDSFEVRDITRLIMFLEKQFKKNKFRVLNLLWYGGEPLLNIKFMEKFSEELFRFMKAYNIAKGDMMLITNGVLLSRSDIAQKLAKLQINKIQITLDGIPHEHDKIRKYPDGRGTFNEILKALRNIFKYTKARVILRINISRKNVKHMEELIKYIYNNELLAKCEVFPAFIIRWNELTDDEKVRACELAKRSRANYVKTSTGFGPGGATAEDVALMSSVVRQAGIGVKAAGGIRSYEDARKMIEAGATRIGASAGIKILQEAKGVTVSN